MTNAVIVILLLTLNAWQFLVVPLLSPGWALTLIPLAFTSNTLWAAIHEAVHGNLFRNARLNRWAGQALSCVFGSSFHFLSAGHLTHHAMNRQEEQLEVLKPGESIWSARARYYFFLCGGLYLAEMFVPVAFLVPLGKRLLRSLSLKLQYRDLFTARVLWRALSQHRQVAFEAAASVSFLVVSAVLYGERWLIILAILGARALFISSLDYIYHYGNPVGKGAALAADNLYLPRPLSVMLLNFNLHAVHHATPHLRWHQLIQYKEAQGYATSFWSAAIRVWRGPQNGK